ncbi:hypothetical protein TNCV_2503931 [Trichonephila clavipes]|nr:hypothetical protein TNCV_2503931 [Trichonephila clavipes]
MTMEAIFFIRETTENPSSSVSVRFPLPTAESREGGGGYLRFFCVRIARIGIRLLSHRRREVSLFNGGRRRGCCGAGADAPRGALFLPCCAWHGRNRSALIPNPLLRFRRRGWSEDLFLVEHFDLLDVVFKLAVLKSNRLPTTPQKRGGMNEMPTTPTERAE